MSSTERLPRTLTLMPTYACTASCRHCGTLSHPNARHRLDLDTVLVAIREAHELGFANVVFTGGEATLEWPNLLEGISCAHALRMPVRLVTNAHWATSPEVAAGRLAELRDAGLSEINFSTGDEHARFVPVDAVVTASLASVRLGFAPFIMVELREERRVTKSVVLALLQASSQGQDELARIRIEESPWMPLSPSKVAQYPEGVAVDSKNLARQRGCDNVLQTFVVQADGRIGACCGLGMRLIPELQVEHAVGVGFLARAIERAGAGTNPGLGRRTRSHDHVGGPVRAQVPGVHPPLPGRQGPAGHRRAFPGGAADGDPGKVAG
jgi:organic radical activating enzyme